MSCAAYYKKHKMTPGDLPPIGILLCTRKNDALVEFALGDLSNQVFVSRYAVELPRKEEMERFITQLGKDVAQELSGDLAHEPGEKSHAKTRRRNGGKE